MAASEAARALGKLRAKTLDAEHQSTAAKARAKSLSKKRRSEIARMGALAKAKKQAANKKTLRRKSNGD